jgi:iron complex outermembrane recepter protein
MSGRAGRLAAVGCIVMAGNAYAQATPPPPTQLDPLVVEGSSKPKPAKTKKAKPASKTKQAATPATPATSPVPAQREGSASPTRNTYQPSNALSATKTDTPIIETPQSISTVTRKQLDDQNQQTVAGALGYTAGVLASFEQNARYDNVFLRGFGGFSTSGNYVRFLDGMKLPQGQVFGIMSIDPFLLDRIDVLKGPSAMLYGQVSPGGLVNMVSRAPSAVPYNELRFEMGSYGRMQAGYTTQGALDKEGTLQYSLTATGKDSGTRYDDVDERRFAIAPALAWQPDADTRITVSGFYQADPEGGYFNSMYPKQLAASQFQPYLNSEFNPGDPSYDHFDREEEGVGYQLEHRFNSAVLFRSALRYAQLDLDFAGMQLYGALGISPTGDIYRIAARSVEDASNVTSDNQLQLDFSTEALRHRVLTGIDTQRADSSALFEATLTNSINVVDPQYGLPVNGPFATGVSGDQSLDQTGIYVQDQLALGNWRALVGVRHDWAEQVTEPTGGAVQSQRSEATTYRAGLLYMFDNGLAPYASYSTSFEPVIGTDASGSPFVPTEAEQYEVGIKYQSTFIPALFTFSAFDITQQNVRTPGPNPNFSIQTGEIRSRGLEFEARGNVTKELGVIAALTLLDTEVTKSTTTSAVGKRPQAAPGYFGSLWANYGFDFGMLDGFTVGGGVRFVGSSYGDDANTLKAPGYTLVDMAVSYDLGKLDYNLTGSELTLNVWNLADKEYYSSCSSGYYCEFGDRRTFLAGVRHHW